MKLTSSRWVNRILVGLIILTALIFALQIADHIWSRKIEADEAKQRKEWEQKESWGIAEPPDKSFSVRMPRRPSLFTNYVGPPIGKLPTVQLGSKHGWRPGDVEIYIAAFTEFPTNADLTDKEAIYDNAHVTFADKLGRIRREKTLMLQGVPGRETEVELRNGTNLMVERVYIADRRLYQLTAVVPLSRGASTNTWRFLDSLLLKRN